MCIFTANIWHVCSHIHVRMCCVPCNVIMRCTMCTIAWSRTQVLACAWWCEPVCRAQVRGTYWMHAHVDLCTIIACMCQNCFYTAVCYINAKCSKGMFYTWLKLNVWLFAHVTTWQRVGPIMGHPCLSSTLVRPAESTCCTRHRINKSIQTASLTWL